MALRAAVFDFDGVIVDSEPLHFRSLRDALRPDAVETLVRVFETFPDAYSLAAGWAADMASIWACCAASCCCIIAWSEAACCWAAWLAYFCCW